MPSSEAGKETESDRKRKNDEGPAEKLPAGSDDGAGADGTPGAGGAPTPIRRGVTKKQKKGGTPGGNPKELRQTEADVNKLLINFRSVIGVAKGILQAVEVDPAWVWLCPPSPLRDDLERKVQLAERTGTPFWHRLLLKGDIAPLKKT